MTSDSSPVSRMILMALSMSSRIRRRPLSRCSFSFFFPKTKNTLRRTDSRRQAHHSSSSSRTPRTFGIPVMRTLKLQLHVSCKEVILKSRAISRSGSVPRLRSMVSFRPVRSVSSRMSAISLIFPVLISSATLSRIASMLVE
ncbi:hypothetical protein SDC9_203693 [bioreactor metagenome]|uniref:Uncharacterized protein n=1 Tax=bioreactor metagenome TaxID=1076179 RepID=A0A645IZV9_9ZZZZ